MQTTSRRNFLKLGAGALAAAAIARPGLSWVAAAQHPAESDPTLHMLNRITWGPRPDEIERAYQISSAAFLEEQLNPETIDDSVMDARLADMPILSMDRPTIFRLSDFYYRPYVALTEGMVLRAVHSKRQLLERMVEFWTDHFNMPSDEQAADLVITHREVIRKHALGNFRDLLFGIAQSPPMLYYLDQAYSEKEHPNENYARELMELHTLGVDGGYTETDVKEAARALTGWTVHEGTPTGFYFSLEYHDTGEKTVLGHTMPADRGIEDGLHLLSIVANHPSTAHFLCHKLCVRFVSDNPPQNLVEGAAQVWMQTQGDIKSVLRHIFSSAEFAQSAGQKLRRPLDFFVGALRATGTEFRHFYIMEGLLQDLAQIPYGWHPPNGYPDVAGAWTNSSGLLARWNIAMALTHIAWSEGDNGLDAHLNERIGTPQNVGQLVDAVSMQVFATRLPDDSRSTFITYVTDDGNPDRPLDAHIIASKLGTLYGLMLASPLYQWR